VFDALTSKRDYPKYADGKTMGMDPMPMPKVLEILLKDTPHHFDPQVVNAFFRCLPGLLVKLRDEGHFAAPYAEAGLAALKAGIAPEAG
jgi:HD-GYP domain-containing protein (c-di-GMP phosphodiesterase class II)